MHILVRASARYEYAEIHIQEGKSLLCAYVADRAMSIVARATGPQRHDVQCPVAGKPGGGPQKESDTTLQTVEGQLGSKQSVMRDVAHDGELRLPALPPMPAGVSPCTAAHITITTCCL